MRSRRRTVFSHPSVSVRQDGHDLQKINQSALCAVRPVLNLIQITDLHTPFQSEESLKFA